MPKKLFGNKLRNILYAAALTVITVAVCIVSYKFQVPFFFGDKDPAVCSAVFFASLFLPYLLPDGIAAAVCAAAGAAAAICCPAYLILYFPAVVFLLLLRSADKTDKQSAVLFTAAAILEAVLFCAGLIAAGIRSAKGDSVSLSSGARSTPCAVFMLLFAAYFLYMLTAGVKTKKEKKPGEKKARKETVSEKTKTAYLLGALTALSAAVYLYALLPVYTAKACVGIWAVTVLFSALTVRGLLTKSLGGDEKC